jgi:hypothetical protein
MIERQEDAGAANFILRLALANPDERVARRGLQAASEPALVRAPRCVRWFGHGAHLPARPGGGTKPQSPKLDRRCPQANVESAQNRLAGCASRTDSRIA